MTQHFLTIEDFLRVMAERDEARAKAFQEQEKAFQEQEKAFQERAKDFQEQAKALQEQARAFQEREEKQLKELNKLFKASHQDIEGVKKSLGEEAEAFFLSSLQRKPQLGDIRFDFASKQGKKQKGDHQYQIDIFLENGDAVGVVEVKNKVRLDDIAQLDKQVSEFYEFYPRYADMKIYGAIAGKIIPESVEKAALQKGYFVLKQVGNHMEVVPPQKL